MDRVEKVNIFEALSDEGHIWGYALDENKRADLLNKIWPLHSMESEDPRYEDAYFDAVQHLDNNDDWDDEYTFGTRFKLFSASDETYFEFLNVIVSYEVRYSVEEVEDYVSAINRVATTIEMSVSDVKDGHPVYTAKYKVDNDIRIPVPANTLPFYVDSRPQKYPSFTLKSDTWDDFGNKTTFYLSFNKDPEEIISVGLVKVMCSDDVTTANVIEKEFYILNGHYCSLGDNINYYWKIKQLCPDCYQSVLYALRDAAFFSQIADEFELTFAFNRSLLRKDEAEECLRKAKRLVELNEEYINYDFTINAEIPYSNAKLPVKFSFGNLDDEECQDRIAAIIGENGVGKTSILTSFAKGLAYHDNNYFEGEIPFFSKVIAISYSMFDNLYPISSRSTQNFIYCGMHDSSQKKRLLSEEDEDKRFRVSLDRIKRNFSLNTHGTSHERLYYKCLSKFLEPDVLSKAFDQFDNIDIDSFSAIKKKLSSGQSMIINIITEIYAHIRYNTLILFDEPEIHLHPSGITKIMSMLFEVTREFKSACILATHSSIVLQELRARNVIVLDRIGNDALTREMNVESLGADLSVITEEVFGRSSVDKQYALTIQNLASEGLSQDEIISRLTTEGLSPSIRLYMMVRGLSKNHNAE